MDRPLALVVDRDPAIRAIVRDVLADRDVITLAAGNADEAAETLSRQTVHVLFVDASKATGWQAVVEHASRLDPPPLLVGLGRSDRESPDLDAFIDLLAKPIDEPELRRLGRWAVRQLELVDQLRRVRKALQNREGFHGFVGRSPVMERLREQLRPLAQTDSSVWFGGEDGCGKELAARTVHGLSARSERAFVVIGCSGLTPATWDSMWLGNGEGDELALRTRAEGGTLYFDEIAELSVPMQEKLLAFLETQEHSVRNADRGSRVGVRVLAASTWEPRAAVGQGRLLEDLFGALSAATLQLPPLVERLEDVPLLARHFVTRISEINHLPAIRISPEAMQRLEDYSWPGNVQELRNAVEHAAILAADGVIRPRDLPDKIAAGDAGGTDASGSRLVQRKFRDAKREVVEAFERSYLSQLLESHGGNVTSASQQAGMLRSALQRLLRKHGLKSAEFRDTREGRPAASASKPRELE